MSSGQAAVLGLGVMGAAVARRLASQSPAVRVWNRTASKAAALAAERFATGGALVACASAAEATAAASEVLVVFDSYEAASAVLVGDPECREALAGKTVFVLIAGAPGKATALGRALEDAGAGVVDAFFLGGAKQIDMGTINVYFSCSEDLRERASATLGLLGVPHFVSTELAGAKGVELCTGTLWQSTYLGFASAFAFADKHGVPADTVLGAWAALQAPIETFAGVLARNAVAEREFADPTLFALKGLAKSNAKHVAEARAAGLETAAAFHEARLKVVQDAIDRVGEDSDIRGCYEAFNPSQGPKAPEAGDTPRGT